MRPTHAGLGWVGDGLHACQTPQQAGRPHVDRGLLRVADQVAGEVGRLGRGAGLHLPEQVEEGFHGGWAVRVEQGAAIALGDERELLLRRREGEILCPSLGRLTGQALGCGLLTGPGESLLLGALVVVHPAVRKVALALLRLGVADHAAAFVPVVELREGCIVLALGEVREGLDGVVPVLSHAGLGAGGPQHVGKHVGKGSELRPQAVAHRLVPVAGAHDDLRVAVALLGSPGNVEHLVGQLLGDALGQSRIGLGIGAFHALGSIEGVGDLARHDLERSVLGHIDLRRLDRREVLGGILGPLLAPHIDGNRRVDAGILCQLFDLSLFLRRQANPAGALLAALHLHVEVRPGVARCGQRGIRRLGDRARSLHARGGLLQRFHLRRGEASLLCGASGRSDLLRGAGRGSGLFSGTDGAPGLARDAEAGGDHHPGALGAAARDVAHQLKQRGHREVGARFVGRHRDHVALAHPCQLATLGVHREGAIIPFDNLHGVARDADAHRQRVLVALLQLVTRVGRCWRSHLARTARREGLQLAPVHLLLPVILGAGLRLGDHAAVGVALHLLGQLLRAAAGDDGLQLAQEAAPAAVAGRLSHHAVEHGRVVRHQLPGQPLGDRRAHALVPGRESARRAEHEARGVREHLKRVHRLFEDGADAAAEEAALQHLAQRRGVALDGRPQAVHAALDVRHGQDVVGPALAQCEAHLLLRVGRGEPALDRDVAAGRGVAGGVRHLGREALREEAALGLTEATDGVAGRLQLVEVVLAEEVLPGLQCVLGAKELGGAVPHVAVAPAGQAVDLADDLLAQAVVEGRRLLRPLPAGAARPVSQLALDAVPELDVRNVSGHRAAGHAGRPHAGVAPQNRLRRPGHLGHVEQVHQVLVVEDPVVPVELLVGAPVHEALGLVDAGAQGGRGRDVEQVADHLAQAAGLPLVAGVDDVLHDAASGRVGVGRRPGQSLRRVAAHVAEDQRRARAPRSREVGVRDDAPGALVGVQRRSREAVDIALRVAPLLVAADDGLQHLRAESARAPGHQRCPCAEASAHSRATHAALGALLGGAV